MKSKTINLKIIILLSATILIACNASLKELKHMDESVLFEFTDYDSLPPQGFYAGAPVANLFTVPVQNSVGTNDLENAVSYLTFQGKDVERHIVKKNFLDDVTGNYDNHYLPIWSDDEIAFSYGRGFIIADVKKHHAKLYRVVSGFEDDIGNVRVLDGKSRIFVFEKLSMGEGDREYIKTLQVIKFENGHFEVLGQHPAGSKVGPYSEPWFVHDKKIFIYNDTATRIDVFDSAFNKTTHPLADAFNEKSKQFRSLYDIVVHPTLPFAILLELGKRSALNEIDKIPIKLYDSLSKPIFKELERRVIHCLRWEESDPKQRLIPIVNDSLSIWKTFLPEIIGDFTISPDGKWLVCSDGTINEENPCFVAIPIDEKNPLYLGKPIKLGGVLRKEAKGPTGTAWATDPTAFVMSDGLLLYKWDLGDIGKLKKVKIPEKK
jgi:hypothetical protein